MGELTLVGLHDDGEHVVVEGADGQRFRLRIDEALRAAVRRDRPRLEQARVETTHTLPPREIQARIRAGATAEEVAADNDMPLGLVRRYEGPVLAERSFVAGQAQNTRIGHDADAPALGELVTNRLATRGVPSEAIRWDASRATAGPWTVEVRFQVGENDERTACWRYDAQARTLRAEDDEARWLSETELPDSPVPRRHLAAVRPEIGVDAALRPVLASVDLPPEPAPEPERSATEDLLDDLTGRRGTRQELQEPDEEDDEDVEGFGPQHAFDFENPDLTLPPPAHPPHSRPEEAVDARILPMPSGRRAARAADEAERSADVPDTPVATDTQEAPPADESATPPEATPARHADAEPEAAPGQATPAQEEHTSAPRPRSRRGRASVPSWDEIVFGAKSD